MLTQDTSLKASDELGVLGTGRMGVRLAAMFARSGRRVILGSRDPARAARITDAMAIPGLVPGSLEQAAEADAVLPAVFLRDGLLDVLAAFDDLLAHKLVIDISNPFNDDYSDSSRLGTAAAPRHCRRASSGARGRCLQERLLGSVRRPAPGGPNVRRS